MSLLKEIIQDEFADKVRVEGVVDDFCSAKLEVENRNETPSKFHEFPKYVTPGHMSSLPVYTQVDMAAYQLYH